MSQNSIVSYRLRPNKAVDRELFLSLLARLAAKLRLEKYPYLGLGGPFLEDFRLIHARIGIERMISIEKENAVHLRQLFNRPIESIECVNNTLEDYLQKSEFLDPVVVWLDYTAPSEIVQQIETFVQQVCELPIGSIVRITLNANPTSLGKPTPEEIAVTMPGEEPKSTGNPTELDWRLARFKERLGDYFPSQLSSDDMTHRNYGRSLLKALRLAAEREILNHSQRKLTWALATHYSDGQAMVTATAIIVQNDDEQVWRIVSQWPFYSTPLTPLLLDLPALSTLERLTMESSQNPKGRMQYELPKSDMGDDPYDAFKRFYRVYPHFARVDL